MPRNPDQQTPKDPNAPTAPAPVPPAPTLPPVVPLQPPRTAANAAPAAPSATTTRPPTGSSYGAQRAPAGAYTPPPPVVPPAPAPAAPVQGAGLAGGKGPALPEFQRPVGNTTGPTDFVNFGTYAGLNAGQLKGIADQAMQKSAGKQQEAMKLLQNVEAEASAAGVPAEQTPSWQAYQDAMSAVNDQGNGLEGGFDGNYMESALRGVYSPWQNNRLAQNWETNQVKARTTAQHADQRIAAAAKAKKDAENASVMAASQQRMADRRAAMAEQRSNGTEASPAGRSGQVDDSGGDLNNRYRARNQNSRGG